MTITRGNISHISSRVIEGSGTAGCSIDGDTCGAGEEVIPLVRGEMPVHFAHGAGLDGDEGSGEVGGDGEGGCVDYFYGTAGDGVRGLL